MKKNFICLRNCEYVHKLPLNCKETHVRYKFHGGMAYIIPVTYILSDKDDLHVIHKDNKTLIHGYGSTKFIYKNFVLEDDYLSVTSLFSLLFGLNTLISDEDAKMMRESLFKNSLYKKG